MIGMLLCMLCNHAPHSQSGRVLCLAEHAGARSQHLQAIGRRLSWHRAPSTDACFHSHQQTVKILTGPHNMCATTTHVFEQPRTPKSK